MRDLLIVVTAFGPIFFGLAVHGVCLRFGWLRALQLPMDGGLRWRQRRIFGANKTLRGVVAVAIGTALGYFFVAALHGFDSPPWPEHNIITWSGIGFALGSAAMLAELPNSFLKRQLDVPPGGVSSGLPGVLLYLFDQVDLLLGGWLVIGPIVGLTWPRLLWSLLFVTVVHQAVSLIGAKLGMRESAR